MGGYCFGRRSKAVGGECVTFSKLLCPFSGEGADGRALWLLLKNVHDRNYSEPLEVKQLSITLQAGIWDSLPSHM